MVHLLLFLKHMNALKKMISIRFPIYYVAVVSILTAQKEYLQRHVFAEIDVKINYKRTNLPAFEEIEYINNSPHNPNCTCFYIWPNVYKNDFTALAKKLLKLGFARAIKTS